MSAADLRQNEVAVEDAELVAQVQAGDEAAFTQLVRKYQQQVFNLILYYTGNKNEVEDLAQDVFVKVYTHLGNFETRATFRTWLYRITLNVCIDHARRRKLRRMLSLDGLSEWSRERLTFDLQATDTPEAHAERRELDEHIRRSIARLPEDFRRVLVLRDLQELEYEEIAAITGWSLGTVKSRLFRARRRMQQFLRPYVEETQ